MIIEPNCLTACWQVFRNIPLGSSLHKPCSDRSAVWLYTIESCSTRATMIVQVKQLFPPLTDVTDDAATFSNWPSMVLAWANVVPPRHTNTITRMIMFFNIFFFKSSTFNKLSFYLKNKMLSSLNFSILRVISFWLNYLIYKLVIFLCVESIINHIFFNKS